MPSNDLQWRIRETERLGAIPLMTVCQVPSKALTLESLRRCKEVLMANDARSKHFPHCHGFEMVEAFNRNVFVCIHGGCDRIVTVADWLNDQVTPKKPWRPTVPHPLLQMDEELRR
jgi:hypothetical protein